MKDVRVLWMAAILLTTVAMYRLGASYERAIAASETTVETLYRNTTNNQRLVAHAADLRAAQALAERDLRGVSRDRSLPAATASLLVTLQESASRYHVGVLALQPGTSVVENRLIATDLTVRMRGRFRDTVAFLEHISRGPPILSVSRTDLALSSQSESTRGPELDATIHATLYRLQTANPTGDDLASTR